MKIETVWGVLPVFVFESEDIPGQGRANGPVVRLKPGASDAIRAHERIHVKQFYLDTLVAAGLLLAAVLMQNIIFVGLGLAWAFFSLTETHEFLTETAAYAEQARVLAKSGILPPEQAIAHVATVYNDAHFYKEDRAFDEIRDQIERRFKDGRII